MSLPPIELIRKCPSCGNLFETDGGGGVIHMESGMPWTDGDCSDDITLMDEFHKCNFCLKTFHIDDSKIVAIDNMNIEVINGFIHNHIHVEKRFSYLNIPSLKDYTGSTKKHKDKKYYPYYLPLEGLPANYTGVPYSMDSVRVDYVEVLEKKLYTTLEQELEIRLRIWWGEKRNLPEDINNINEKNTKNICFDSNFNEDNLTQGYFFEFFYKILEIISKAINKKTPENITNTNQKNAILSNEDNIIKDEDIDVDIIILEEDNILRSFSLSEKATENICRMIEIWHLVPRYNNNYLPYVIMKSDMFRQIGRFDECLNTLKEHINIDIISENNIYSDIINLIIISCKKNIKCVRKGEFNRSWW